MITKWIFLLIIIESLEAELTKYVSRDWMVNSAALLQAGHKSINFRSTYVNCNR